MQSQLIQLLSDTQAATADTVAKLTALGHRNDALESQYPQIDLQGVAGRTIDFASLIATPGSKSQRASTIMARSIRCARRGEFLQDAGPGTGLEILREACRLYDVVNELESA